ncbi:MULTISPECIES: hypothetical protein [Bacillus]|jgi:hypothetical protein|uniref:Uncharacterized protein n=2 Tax=Bacillus thuringiensis TaxID=1428 RepID=A0A9W3PJA8_BACTU|nr:hypothetical protein [Bacillus thuringiensis]HDR3896899.1 hypothetical protein [Bacillus cereus]AHA75320.1 hypothetical protein YBT1518_34316 [Bacillus thuringiensis YBT-1518]MBG9482965.1 phage protein [Bacillus thuringiensis]MBG9503839.1 phage protein [Bacillus thuringiensis]MBG9517021.1 phage protein [Bacillus thuringiensis]
MSQYQMLYSTPYLYSSRTLQQMYKSTKKEEYITAIQEHMLRHDVYLDRQYRGYYYLSQKIEEDLYDDEHPVSWNDLLEDYQLFKDSQGNLSIQPKGWR